MHMMLEEREKPKERIKDHLIDVSKNVVSGLLLLAIPAIALIFLKSFNWIMLMIVLQDIALIIFIGYILSAKHKLEEKNRTAAAELKEELTTFKLEYIKLVQQ